MSTKYIVYDLETSGLMDSLVNRILSIAVVDVNDPLNVTVWCGEDEKKILTDFFTYINSFSEYIHLIGFNSDSFDVPFLIRRSVILGVKVPITKFKSVDLRKIVNGFQYSYNRNEKGTLRDWAMMMGVPVTTDAGSEMFKLFMKKDWDSIQRHNGEDVQITLKLFQHAQSAGLINNGYPIT